MSMDDLHAAFDMVDAIRAIVRCESIIALKVLRKVIDDRMEELGSPTLKDERVTQKSERKLPIAKRTYKKHEQIEEKAERKGKKRSGRQPLFISDLILRRYDTLAIYKPVVDAVLDKVPSEFSYRDVAKIISSFLVTRGRAITEKSSDKYAALYIKYLVSEELIVAERRGHYKKAIKKYKPEGVVNGIYVDCEDTKRKKIVEKVASEQDVRDFEEEAAEPQDSRDDDSQA